MVSKTENEKRRLIVLLNFIYAVLIGLTILNFEVSKYNMN